MKSGKVDIGWRDWKRAELEAARKPRRRCLAEALIALGTGAVLGWVLSWAVLRLFT